MSITNPINLKEMKMKNLMIYALLLLPIGLMAQCTSEKQEQKADENVVVKTIMSVAP